MKSIEDLCTPQMIIQCREDALNQLSTLMKDDNNVKDDEIEQKIKEEVKKQVQWYTTGPQRKKIEAKIRKEQIKL